MTIDELSTTGEAAGVLLVDAHQHAGDLASVLSFDGSELRPEPSVEDDAAARVAGMDAIGVAWAVLQPSHGYSRADGVVSTRRLNDRMAEYHEVAPGRFRAFGTTEPNHAGAGVDEVDHIADVGLSGVAWHHRFQGCYVDNRWMWPTLRRMQERGLVPLVHVNAESSLEAHWRLQRLALDFPDLTFLAMDGFWSYERARHVLVTASTTPNVIWDLGGPVCYLSIPEWVERNGSTTLCFSAGGSYATGGTPVLPPIHQQIVRSPISDEDRANILGRNVARALQVTP